MQIIKYMFDAFMNKSPKCIGSNSSESKNSFIKVQN